MVRNILLSEELYPEYAERECILLGLPCCLREIAYNDYCRLPWIGFR